MQAIQRSRSQESSSRRGSAQFAIGPCATSRLVDGATDIFESHRSRLFGVAYRMLRTRADAEDVLQDAYLRWHETATSDRHAQIQSPVAFLITVTTRLCLDRLRHANKQRQDSMAAWLPEANED